MGSATIVQLVTSSHRNVCLRSTYCYSTFCYWWLCYLLLWEGWAPARLFPQKITLSILKNIILHRLWYTLFVLLARNTIRAPIQWDFKNISYYITHTYYACILFHNILSSIFFKLRTASSLQVRAYWGQSAKSLGLAGRVCIVLNPLNGSETTC